MNSKYEPLVIEPKWQKVWSESKLYEVTEDSSRPKVYATPMLPYPSGVGMHVGHIRNYSISDAVARFYRQRGHNVMTNMGWDSFGLPAENFAIKTGTPPAKSTADNIQNFKKQLKRTGISFAWDRELNTSDPEYYKWTQWLFTQFFKKGLAYQDTNLQWWCTKCMTVLANEQVVNSKCWRHDAPDDPEVEKRRTNQWFLKITEYADQLLEGLDRIDWPESIKSQQRNWIGRSVGAEINFEVPDTDTKITAFSTRVDTIYGATFIVLAPEYEGLDGLVKEEHREDVDAYVASALKRSDLDRMANAKTKTGVFTGAYAVNPVTKEKMPIWVSDFVLGGYGTGAVMAVPGHDQRDHDFAVQFDLPIVEVVKRPEGKHDESVYTGEGELINSSDRNGMRTAEAREVITSQLSENGAGSEKTNYKMRDWLISRQRYWGAPIPIIHCNDCGAVPVPEEDLPVLLPEVENFEPTGEATSVLAAQEEWVSVDCPGCQGPGRRETDTMDGYVCSSWYMYRYCDAGNETFAWDPEKVNYWFPVDYYFGGDHAVAHLLYFRFWHRFFVDEGLIDSSIEEPVKTLVYNGYINAADGRKMSKSLGNVVDPLEVIESGYGADALRMFELFVGPYEQDVSWNEGGVPGTYRFLQRVWTLVYDFLQDTKIDYESADDPEAATKLEIALQKTAKKVTEDLEGHRFNTAIAAMMTLSNELYELRGLTGFGYSDAPITWKKVLERFAQLLGPFAPFIAEEIWSELGNDGLSIHIAGWPSWDDNLIADDQVTVAVQVNGKLKGEMLLAKDAPQEGAEETAREISKVEAALKGRQVIKTVYVPGRILNFVIR